MKEEIHIKQNKTDKKSKKQKDKKILDGNIDMEEYDSRYKRWMETDIESIEQALTTTSHISKEEFEYTFCPLCPYSCVDANFCWNLYIKYVNAREGDVNIPDIYCFDKIIKTLIRIFYKSKYIDVSSFYFMTTFICPACGTGCIYKHSKSFCASLYLGQMKNEKTLGYEHKETHKKKQIVGFVNDVRHNPKPSLYIDGEKMVSITKKLWNIVNNEISTDKERFDNIKK